MSLDEISKYIKIILLIMAGGILVELLFLEHFEEWQQWLPLAIVTLAMLLMLFGLSRLALWSFLLLLVVGFYGVYLHFSNNLEFELEMRPSLSGLELYKRAMFGALPVLAPGSLIPVGLLGILYLKSKKTNT